MGICLQSTPCAAPALQGPACAPLCIRWASQTCLLLPPCLLWWCTYCLVFCGRFRKQCAVKSADSLCRSATASESFVMCMLPVRDQVLPLSGTCHHPLTCHTKSCCMACHMGLSLLLAVQLAIRPHHHSKSLKKVSKACFACNTSRLAGLTLWRHSWQAPASGCQGAPIMQ